MNKPMVHAMRKVRPKSGIGRGSNNTPIVLIIYPINKFITATYQRSVLTFIPPNPYSKECK